MSSVEVYKTTMGTGLKKFFESYEPSMNDLINQLDRDGLLLRNFSGEQVTRLQELMGSSNMALKLFKDFGQIFKPENKQETNEKLEYLKKAFETEDLFRIGEHYHSILVNTYIAFLERLKIYFLFFIDWTSLGKRHRDIHGINTTVNFLKQRYPNNSYLDYFESGTRNSLTHYTFSWEHGNGGKIKLYSEIFDNTPNEVALVKFMMEINELQVLTEGFYILLRDKFNLPELNLSNMEK